MMEIYEAYSRNKKRSHFLFIYATINDKGRYVF